MTCTERLNQDIFKSSQVRQTDLHPTSDAGIFKLCIEIIDMFFFSHERQIRNRDLYSMAPAHPARLTGRPETFIINDEEYVETRYTMTMYRFCVCSFHVYRILSI